MVVDSAERYQRRVVDDEIDELAVQLPAIALEGPRAVGKTSTALQRARSIYRLDRDDIREVVAADPDAALRAAPPVLLDEWQRLPQTWDLVRRLVDAGAQPGQYLLTGSADPGDAPQHSGAGRIVRVRMRPMSFMERGVSLSTVGLGQLLVGDRPVIGGESDIGVTEYVDEIARSGFPGLRGLDGRRRSAALGTYVDRLIDRDFAEAGRTVRRPELLRRWLRAYAAATASTASWESIRDGATPGEGVKPTKVTTQPWRDVLERLWILDPVPAWLPTRNHLRELGAAPKHHLADPALAMSLLGLAPAGLLGGRGPRNHRDGTFLGALFESLATLSIRVYAQANECRVGHLRTHRGEHELDLVVERPDQRVLGVEVKLKATVDDRDVAPLHWFASQVGSDLVDLVVVTTGRYAYRRADGVAVVPLALLGP